MKKYSRRIFPAEPRWLDGPLLLAAVLPTAFGLAAGPVSAEGLHERAVPLVKRYCIECHSGDVKEGDVDLSAVDSPAGVRGELRVWQRAAEMVATRQMPPADAPQPDDEDRKAIDRWLQAFLAAEARSHAGDPGRVVLRRLNNAEYTHTIRDLTAVDSLDPGREFPADGGAGEGFTNTGHSLVMSPALVTKYFDAAKEVAGHAVLLPDGFRFSSQDSRRDWTDEWRGRIQDFYRRFTRPHDSKATEAADADTNAEKTVVDGVALDVVGRDAFLPLEAYLEATLALRGQTAVDDAAIEKAAGERGLTAKYLATLWHALADDADGKSLLLDRLRSRWRETSPEDAAALAAEAAKWQAALWKFNKVGQMRRHLGRSDGPPSWLEQVTPLLARQEFRNRLQVKPGQGSITLRLIATSAGDGNDADFVVWEHPRLVAKGRADLPLKAVRGMAAALEQSRDRLASTTIRCLDAVAEAATGQTPLAIAALARRHEVDETLLAGWLQYLGIVGPPAKLEFPLARRIEAVEGRPFIRGWGGDDSLAVIANASDQTALIPGTMKPHGVAVQPGTKRRAVVGWRSPVAGPVRIAATLEGVHVGCSNGMTWALDLWRGRTRQWLAGETLPASTKTSIGPIGPIDVRPGEIVSLAIGSAGSSACDLTAVDLVITSGDREWNLARDVSADILAGNPHAGGGAGADGDAGVWHFAAEADPPETAWEIPAGSLLARWLLVPAAGGPKDGAAERAGIAAELQRLLAAGPAAVREDSADAELRRSLTSPTGPILARSLDLAALEAAAPATTAADAGEWGIDPALFGRHPQGAAVDPRNLCVQAPATIEIRVPAALVDGCELVSSGWIHPDADGEASVQLKVSTDEVLPADLVPDRPVIAREGSAAWRRFERSFDDFRQLLPRALCYARIVPVDEGVTLNLFYREDDQLRRLFLDDAEAAELDRLWDEFLFVAREPLLLEDAFEQLSDYATQTSPEMATTLAEMIDTVAARAAAFQRRLADSAPRQHETLLALAARAYRRPLSAEESQGLLALHAALRADGLPHEEAFAMTLARVLVAPAFLYKAEKPAAGTAAAPVTDHELAGRLSYFLWSSLPDDELLREAAAGRLRDPAVLLGQTRRMVRGPKIRRLAEEFGTQWLHVHGFAEHDEKSAQAFPTFAGLREAMEEETILFLEDFFRNDRPVLSLLDADHAFVNGPLAAHYSIDGVEGPGWRQVDGVRSHGRGGILFLASTLATQSGASRTSPILRGNWISEVILGEKLPRPPKNVPQLSDTVPPGLTERQLVELHSSNAGCAKCHSRIDPFGFSLEHFDAIGRFRIKDSAGNPVDAKTRLADGREIDGHEGLRSYLLNDRRDQFVRQFCRKLLGYALGRAVQLSDEPLLDEIGRSLANGGGRVSAVLESIVASPQFRGIRGRDAVETDTGDGEAGGGE